MVLFKVVSDVVSVYGFYVKVFYPSCSTSGDFNFHHFLSTWPVIFKTFKAYLSCKLILS